MVQCWKWNLWVNVPFLSEDLNLFSTFSVSHILLQSGSCKKYCVTTITQIRRNYFVKSSSNIHIQWCKLIKLCCEGRKVIKGIVRKITCPSEQKFYIFLWSFPFLCQPWATEIFEFHLIARSQSNINVVYKLSYNISSASITRREEKLFFN